MFLRGFVGFPDPCFRKACDFQLSFPCHGVATGCSSRLLIVITARVLRQGLQHSISVYCPMRATGELELSLFLRTGPGERSHNLVWAGGITRSSVAIRELTGCARFRTLVWQDPLC